MTEALRDHERAARAERQRRIGGGDRPTGRVVYLQDRASLAQKGSAPSTGISAAEAQLLGEYNLHND